MASRRYRAKNSLNSNISHIDTRLSNLETRPAPRRVAANSISTANIQAEAIDASMLQIGVIDSTMLAGGAVGAAQIQDAIVTANKIFDGAVTSVKIAEGAIDSAKLAANSVTSAAIAANAIVNSKLAANAVQSINIVANAIDTTKIAADAVTNLQIAANAVSSLEIAPNAVVIGKIAANAVDSTALAAAAVTGTKIAANAVTANAIQANSITAAKIDVGAVTANALAANAVTANAIAANAVTANAILANSITGVKIAANTITGNNILAGSVTGDRITANTLYGNTIVANTLSGNTIIANTLSGNTIVANTLLGNSIVANTINGNTIIANTLSGNTILANTLSGNTVIANTISGNTIIANTLSGNTVIANSLRGETVVANTLYGNAIVAGSITGDRILATTSIRLADSVSPTPANYIQFGYITLPGASGAGPGISGSYSGSPSFYLGGFNEGGTTGKFGFSLGIYDTGGVSWGVLTSDVQYDSGSNPYNYVGLGGGKLTLSSTGGSFSDPSYGDMTIATGWGDIDLEIGTVDNQNGLGGYSKIRLKGPTQVQTPSAGNALILANDNAPLTIGNTGAIRIKISADEIQAVSAANGTSPLYINKSGGFVSFGSSIYTNGATSLTGWQSASDFSAMGGGAVYSTNTAAGLLLSRNNTVNGNIAQFYRGSTTIVGSISVTATTTAFNTSSDYRLKENITPITDAIAKVMRLKPSRFNFKIEPDEVMDGFIAHELAEVVPMAVTGQKDAVDENGEPVYQAVDAGKIVPLIAAALQEAITRIETLESKLA